MSVLPDSFPILVNPAAGGAATPEPIVERLVRAFAAHRRRVDCRVVAAAAIGDRVRALAREGHGAVGVGGGDGTLSGAAQALAFTRTALVPLPFGTRNHFVQDLGLPLDLEAAVGALAAGRIGAVDLGEVNGRVFINNASVGLYTRAVRWRESLLAGLPVGKRVATWYVLAALAWRLPRYRLSVEIDGNHPERLRVPFLFVGNNRYAERPLSLASRERLDAGRLHVTYPQAASYRAALGLLLSLLLEPLLCLPQPGHLNARTLRLRARRRRVTAALDGELHRLAVPLDFAIREGALRVALPAGD